MAPNTYVRVLYIYRHNGVRPPCGLYDIMELYDYYVEIWGDVNGHTIWEYFEVLNGK